ncbi:hypothetical protein L596_024177 [Steinernema carpocapsae]|uniref:snRNA-activating protein complex subunit 3 n=1 Tax=Steinernema carpocapsae TaxID=34508 RepID=A0A4U5MFZ3_STECR|nr:hypothetical protein L596_024177 [Steinernema carpocapsae]
MAMDAHFDADNLKFCSPVINVKQFLEDAYEEQRSMEAKLGLISVKNTENDEAEGSSEDDDVRNRFKEFLKNKNVYGDQEESVTAAEQVIERIDRGTEQMFNSTPLTDYPFTGYVHNTEFAVHKEQEHRREYAEKHNRKFLNSVFRRRLKYAFYEPSELERDYCLGKRPMKDILVTVHIMRPSNKWHSKGDRVRPVKAEYKYVVRGETTLHELRDKFICSADFCTMVPDHEDATESSVYHVEQYPSNFLFIHDTFYLDMRKPNAKDIAQVVREFMHRNKPEFGVTHVADMEGVKIKDLVFRLGFPYNYTHQGSCEHLFQFTDLRLMNAQDEERIFDYPFKVFDISKIPKCAACKMNTPAFVVQNSDRLPDTLMLMCNVCFKTFHYENDKPVGKFNAYHYFCPQ